MMFNKAQLGVGILFIMLLLVAFLIIALTSPAFDSIVSQGVINSGMTGLEAMFFNNWPLVLIFGATLGFYVFISRG